jgi:hypothetical protein
LFKSENGLLADECGKRIAGEPRQFRTIGGIVNLRTGETLDINAMRRLFSQDELLQVPIGHRRPPPQSHQSGEPQ